MLLVMPPYVVLEMYCAHKDKDEGFILISCGHMNLTFCDRNGDTGRCL